MKDLIKAMDNLPWIVKLILCIPALDIVWVIYRIVKSLVAGNTLAIVLSIVLLIVGIPWLWAIDLVFVLLKKQVWWFC
ncbi:MAG: hypothetical protein J6D21_06810 [Clostridia bacterium]|nr:hypothetical protein [Clostridia bacterium]